MAETTMAKARWVNETGAFVCSNPIVIVAAGSAIAGAREMYPPGTRFVSVMGRITPPVSHGLHTPPRNV